MSPGCSLRVFLFAFAFRREPWYLLLQVFLLVLNSESNHLATLIRALKKGRTVMELEQKSYDESARPFQEKQ
jgi:hypothetical protein